MDIIARCKSGGGSGSNVAGVLGRMNGSDWDDGIECCLRRDGANDVVLELRKRIGGGSPITIATSAWTGDHDSFYEVTLEIRAGNQKGYIDGIERVSATEPDVTLQNNTYGGPDTVAVGGSMGASGGLALVALLPVSGAMTSDGQHLSEAGMPVAGVMATQGSVQVETALPLAGTQDAVGQFQPHVQTDHQGSQDSSGAVANVVSALLSIAGTLTSGGSVGRTVLAAFSGVLGSRGTLRQAVAHVLQGTQSSSGVVANAVTALLSVAGSMASTGSLVRKVLQPLSGMLTSGGGLLPRIYRSFTGVLSSLGSLITQLLQGLFRPPLKGGVTLVQEIRGDVTLTVTMKQDVHFVDD